MKPWWPLASPPGVSQDPRQLKCASSPRPRRTKRAVPAGTEPRAPAHRRPHQAPTGRKCRASPPRKVIYLTPAAWQRPGHGVGTWSEVGAATLGNARCCLLEPRRTPPLRPPEECGGKPARLLHGQGPEREPRAWGTPTGLASHAHVALRAEGSAPRPSAQMQLQTVASRSGQLRAEPRVAKSRPAGLGWGRAVRAASPLSWDGAGTGTRPSS